MRVYKPQFLTPLVTVFDDGKRLHCVVTAIFSASFDGALAEERELWSYATIEVEGSVLDEGKPKTRGEYLVHGSCFAHKPDTRQSFVKVNLGEQEKVLAVFGKRTFQLGVASTPEPFDEVPIRFSNAFGGPTYKENPAGTGYEKGPAPQVEVRGHLVKSPTDKAPVAGLGRLEPTWPQRMKRLGTYDDRWKKTRYPGVAEDFDGLYFQLAQEDQWRDEFFGGSEPFSIVNMHRDKAKLDGKLPGVGARCFVKRAKGEMEDVAMRIDTVHFFPHRERQVVVCRGTTSTNSDTLRDIEEVGFALEWLERPRTKEHYLNAFDARRPKLGGAKATLDDTALLPEDLGPKKPDRVVPPGEGLQQRTVERRVQHELEEVRKALVEQGIDPSHVPTIEHVDTSVDPASIETHAPPTEGDIEKKIAAAKEDVIERLRAATKDTKGGFDVDTFAEKLRKGHVGPPGFTRLGERSKIESQITLYKNAGMDPSALERTLADEAFDERLRKLDDFAREAYRKHVQRQSRAPELGADESEALRKTVLEMVKNGESFLEIDLTGADLSGLDLRGAKMSRAHLESANLSGARLEGAELDRAVLARARLEGLDLTQCKLDGANLSESSLVGANLRGVDLSGGFLVGADLTRATLAEAKLDRVDMGRAILRETNLAGVTATGLKLTKLRLEQVSMEGAALGKAFVDDCDLVGLDARRARLPALTLLDSRLEGARFDDASMKKLRAVRARSGTTFEKCSFVGADLEKAHFRGSRVIDCDFSHAELGDSDFSEGTLDGSRFDDARARLARFMDASLRGCHFDRTDLMDGLLSNATMDGATFAEANLYRVDFGRSGGEDVDMGGANVKWSRVLPKREEPA